MSSNRNTFIAENFIKDSKAINRTQIENRIKIEQDIFSLKKNNTKFSSLFSFS